MQTEICIIASGLLVGWIATTIFQFRAAKKAYARGFDRGVTVARMQHAGTPSCTHADHELLTKITTSLGVAVQTWQAFPGTEPMVSKVAQQRRQLTAFAAKMWLAAYPAPLAAEDFK